MLPILIFLLAADAVKPAIIPDAHQARFWRLSAKSVAAQLAQKNARDAFDAATKELEAAGKDLAVLLDDVKKSTCEAEASPDGLRCKPAKPKQEVP